jgi:hypothetical protein
MDTQHTELRYSAARGHLHRRRVHTDSYCPQKGRSVHLYYPKTGVPSTKLHGVTFCNAVVVIRREPWIHDPRVTLNLLSAHTNGLINCADEATSIRYLNYQFRIPAQYPTTSRVVSVYVGRSRGSACNIQNFHLLSEQQARKNKPR